MEIAQGRDCIMQGGQRLSDDYFQSSTQLACFKISWISGVTALRIAVFLKEKTLFLRH
jgi:hypothetical protein